MNIWRSKLLIFLLLPILASACSEKEVLEDNAKAQGQDVPSAPVKLIIETDSVLDLIFEEQSSILARVVYENNSPAADRPVRFSILGNGQGAELLFNEGTTGSDGRVANPLKAGQIRAEFKVRVETTQNTGEQLFEIIDVAVDGVYKGDLKVTFQYADVLPISSVTTNIHEGPFNCANINFGNLPPVVQTEEAASVGSSVLFRRLPENQTYTVTASGVGPAGNVIALGCKIADPIIGRGVVTAVVPLELNPVEFEGVFDFSTQLHLNEALPSPADMIINDLEQLFSNPDEYLAGLLPRSIAVAALGLDARYVLEEHPDAAVESEIESQRVLIAGTMSAAWVFYASMDPDLSNQPDLDYSLAGALDHFIFNNLPGWANEGLNIGGDVTGLLNHLTVGGKMEILSASEDGYISGEWGWNDFMFRWAFEAGCDPSNACCGRRVYSGEEVGLEPVAAEFNGNVVRHVVAQGQPAPTTVNYDLTIDEHRLNLQYGNIILFVLNEFVLPAATGQDSIACAVESLMGCDSGEFVCGGQSTGVCGCERAGAWLSSQVSAFTPQMAEGACQFAVNAAASVIEGQLNELGFGGTDEGGLSMQVAGSFNDADRDLQADVIDAETTGILYLGDAGQTDFTGDLLANLERLACETDTACASGSTCRVTSDVLNECAGTQVCMPTVGERIGGVRCTADTQCQSGVCLKNETCFQACTEDSDCSGDMVCGIDAFEVDLSDDITVTVTACGQIE